jgi:hypothetical protein
VDRNLFRILWGVALLAAVSISCSLLSDAQQRVDSVRETAESAATMVQSGRDLLSTGQAVVTQFQNNEMVQTAMAMATEQGPAMIATLQAFATNEGPGLLETAQALGTQNPGALETAQALASPIAGGEAPPDIPLVEDNPANLTTTNQFVSYTTSLSLLAVREFYEVELPANGWTQGQVLLDASENVIITYTKPGRQATLNLARLSGSSETVVMIVVDNP